MESNSSQASRVLSMREPRGDEALVLDLGGWRFLVEGLDAPLAAGLARRWGGFCDARAGAGAGAPVRIGVVRGAADLWLPHWKRGERYRVEGAMQGGKLVVRSYAFALAPEEGEHSWRLALEDAPEERIDRVADNAVRFVVARRTLEAGGLALHAGAVLREGGAFVFAGPSRSGKSTAVLHSAPGRSLGDDLVLVVPRDGRWVAPATPFDNREEGDPDPPDGWFPLCGIWRLFRATEDRIEHPPPAAAAASLTGCVALAPAMPDLGREILDRSRELVEAGLYAHLHLRLGSTFWPLLHAGPGS